MIKVRFKRDFGMNTYSKKLYCTLTIEIYTDLRDEYGSPILPAILRDEHTEVGGYTLNTYWADADTDKGCRYSKEELWVFGREGWDKLIEAVWKREMQIEEELKRVIEENKKLLDSMPQTQEREVIISED